MQCYKFSSFLFFVILYILSLASVFVYSFNETFFSFENSENRTINEENYMDYYQMIHNESDNSNIIFIELDDYNNRTSPIKNDSSVFTFDAELTVGNDLGNWSQPITQFQDIGMFGEVYSNSTDISEDFVYDIENGLSVFYNETGLYIEPFKNESGVITSTNETLLVNKANYTNLEEYSLINDSKICSDNSFNGTLNCKRMTKMRISCYLNASGTEHDLIQPFQRIHERAAPKKNVPRYSTINSLCYIRVTGDESYYALHNYDADSAISEIRMIFEQVNGILSKTDFDGDGQQDNMSLRIQNIFLKEATNVTDDYNNSRDFTKLVHEFREAPQNSCISLLFVAMPMDSDLISTAYAGGVCKNNQNKLDLARNLALINVVDSQGCKRSLFATAWTVTMAVGQVMGSVDRDCEPMLPFTAEEHWTLFFSDCGRRNIANLLMTEGSCLKYSANDSYIPKTSSRPKKIKEEILKSSCGNGKMDPGEECDCGTKEKCKKMHSCCAPPGTKNECHYDRSKGYECDWTEDCCTRNCKIVPKFWQLFCGGEDEGCSPEGSVCNGNSSHCSVPKSAANLLNGKMCGPGTLKQVGAATCQQGLCSSTVCRDAGLEDCMCAASTKQQCRVCCRQRSSGTKPTPCIPAEYFELNPDKTKFFYRYPGTHCNEVRFGYCNKDGKCLRMHSSAVPQLLRQHPFIIRAYSFFDVLFWLLIFYLISTV